MEPINMFEGWDTVLVALCVPCKSDVAPCRCHFQVFEARACMHCLATRARAAVHANP